MYCLARVSQGKVCAKYTRSGCLTKDQTEGLKNYFLNTIKLLSQLLLILQRDILNSACSVLHSLCKIAIEDVERVDPKRIALMA